MLKKEIELLNTRLFVIEKSILLEQLSSMTIAELLEIPDWENSKMLGNQSSGFSFNQKINFFLDLNNLEKDLKNKFIVLQEIRNKFAHVLKVNSFKNYKNFSKISAENCKNLEKWYLSKVPNCNENEELKFKFLFDELFKELAAYTIKVASEHAENKGSSLGNKTFNEDYMEELEKIVLQLPNGEVLKSFALDKVQKKIIRTK